MMSNYHHPQASLQFPPPVQSELVPQVSEGDTDTDSSKNSPQFFSAMYNSQSNSQCLQRGPQTDSSNTSPSNDCQFVSSNNDLKLNSSSSLPKPQAASMSSALDALAFACAVEQNYQPRKRSSACSVSSASSATPVSSDDSSSATNRPSTNQNLANEKVACDPQDAPGSSSISHNDVLCGRGGLTNHHPGNIFFRRMVRLRQESYLRASKRDKASVARDIVDTIRQLNPPGRFLKKGGEVWVEIGNRKAREKTSQALREGAPELREELIQSGGGHNLQTESQNTASNNMSIFTEEQRKKLQLEEGQKRSVPFSRAVSLDGSMHNQIPSSSFSQSDSAVTSMQLLPHLISDEKQQQSPMMPLSRQRSLPLSHMHYSDENETHADVPPSAKRIKTEFNSNIMSQNSNMSGIYASTSNHLPVVIRPNSDEDCSPPHSPGRRVGGPRLKMLKNRMGSTHI